MQTIAAKARLSLNRDVRLIIRDVVMPISTADKTKGKQHVMSIVEPFILTLGFVKRPRGEFIHTTADGSEWCLRFSVPTFAPVYRIYPSIRYHVEKLIMGPITDPFQAPNTPNGIRYNFRFHLLPDTYDRCADNLIRWIQDVAMPWFNSSPTTSWINPNIPP